MIFDFIVYIRGSKAPGFFGLTGEALFDHLCQLPRIRETLPQLDRS